ncbi:MAG: M20/M25/M40 family metallo-hydrolase [Lachnospiraceae bacterium]|nr:M20/M25/M40 family metallo-hydrolase [Lachnospiraceae bacterium]
MLSDLTKRFLEYVSIDSESRSEGDFIRHLRSQLVKMGYEPAFYPASDGSDRGNLFLFLEGDKQTDPLLLMAHTDTVTPGRGIKPIVEKEYIHTDKTTILGGDDKAGVSILMELLDRLASEKTAHRPLEILFSYGEESGMNGARDAIAGSYIRSKKALVLDSMGTVGKIVRASAGASRMRATVFGKSAHTGNAISEGINAIQIAAGAISQLPLMEIDHITNANVESISSYGDPGAVTAKCTFTVSVRSGSPKRLLELKEQMTQTVRKSADDFGGSADIFWEDDYPSFEVAKDDELLVEVMRAYEDAGVAADPVYSGGASDANILNDGGIRALNLGNGTLKVHTTDENLHIRSFELLYGIVYSMVTK